MPGVKGKSGRKRELVDAKMFRFYIEAKDLAKLKKLTGGASTHARAAIKAYLAKHS